MTALRKKPTFKEIADKWNAIYLSQPKPPQLKILSGSLALRNSMEVLLHPAKPKHHE